MRCCSLAERAKKVGAASGLRLRDAVERCVRTFQKNVPGIGGRRSAGSHLHTCGTAEIERWTFFTRQTVGRCDCGSAGGRWILHYCRVPDSTRTLSSRGRRVALGCQTRFLESRDDGETARRARRSRLRHVPYCEHEVRQLGVLELPPQVRWRTSEVDPGSGLCCIIAAPSCSSKGGC